LTKDDGETEMSVEFDIDSLQDFRKALAQRQKQAQDIVTAVTNTVKPSKPPVGGFADATLYVNDMQAKNSAYLDRVTKLRDALNVALTGTDQIIKNYQTVESLNHANATDIAKRVDNIGTTLNPKKDQNTNGAV
jgi:chromosome condensin MukBEF ATPase and DNA-binding subunit MukB